MHESYVGQNIFYLLSPPKNEKMKRKKPEQHRTKNLQISKLTASLDAKMLSTTNTE